MFLPTNTKYFCFFAFFNNLLFSNGNLMLPFLFNKCISDDFNKLGLAMYSSLNKSEDPCHDFYGYSCGGWISQTKKPSSEYVWNHYQSILYKINKRIERILKLPNPRNDSLKKTQTYYQSCINIKDFEDKYLHNLRQFLSELGGFVTDEQDIKKLPIEIIIKLKSVLGISPILDINVNIDYKNTSNHILYINPGKLIFPFYILSEPHKYKKELKVYHEWIFNSLKLLYPNRSNSDLKNISKEIVNFEIALATLPADTNNKRITIEKLSENTNINWEKYLNQLFIKTGTTLSKNNVVVVKSYNYLKNVCLLFKKIENKITNNYLLWNALKYLSRETTKHMRYLNFLVDEAILGVSSDISRKDECLDNVKKHFSYTLLKTYLEMYVNPSAINYIKEMIINIKIEFLKVLRRNKWMKKETKISSMEKIKNINYFVGYPKEFESFNYTDNYYKNLTITENNFINTLRIQQFHTELELQNIYSNTEFTKWPSDAFDSNSYYSILQNAIFIPLALLEPPFFHIERPQVFNYGALGSLIGHELAHALDTRGRHADKNGNIKTWWEKDEILRYEEKVRCFENQYKNANGVVTRDENIADSVGLKLSLLAFQNLKIHQHNCVMPHLEFYTKEQLFFMSFSQMWCEVSIETDFFDDNAHAPVHTRVLGTVQNNIMFQKAFNCKNTLDQTCKIW